MLRKRQGPRMWMCLVLMWSKVNLVGTKTRNEKGSSNRTLNLRRRSETDRIASKYRKERGKKCMPKHVLIGFGGLRVSLRMGSWGRLRSAKGKAFISTARAAKSKAMGHHRFITYWWRRFTCLLHTNRGAGGSRWQ
jgi:hypothetical protein